jgi:hypothetical protein
MPNQLNSNELEKRDTIMRWLVEDAWVVTIAPVVNPAVAWMLTSEDPFQRRIAVVQLRQKPDDLVIEGNVVLDQRARE